MFDHLTVKDPGVTPAPTMDPPLTVLGEQPPAPATPEPGKPVEGQPPAAPVPAAPTPKLYAGRFKTPEELEVAYGHSSAEGKRLHGLVTEADKERESLRLENETLKAQLAAPPAPPELTKEQLEQLSPAEQAQYATQKVLREKEAADRKKATEADVKRKAAERAATEEGIHTTAKAMAADPAKFPDYGALTPLMDELLDAVPELRGHPQVPFVTYYAAYGFKALQAARAGAEATAKAAAEAKAKAEADAARAGAGAGGGGTGGSGAGARPGVPGTLDEETRLHNEALLRAAPKRIFST